jgi:hypothetical protein
VTSASGARKAEPVKPGRSPNDPGGSSSAAQTRLDLTFTVTERYYVTDEALEAVKDAPDRDEALIELFELHNGSAYSERFFYHDANPSVGVDVEEVDPDA